jgi:hypothetical protein
MFSYEVKTGLIYGMETNIKSGNGWFTNLEGGHPRTIPPKFGSNWPSGFRGVD